MSLKGQKTTADFMEWNEFSTLLLKLQKDKEFKFCLLIAIGSSLGLRIADILNFKWQDLFDKTEPELKVKTTILVIEKKTGKELNIKVTDDIKNIIKKCFLKLSPNKKDYIFTSQANEVLSVQYVNQKLKSIKNKYHLSLERFSSHTFRKTFGRQVWKENNYSEKALILLSDLFNHASIKDTKRYLGIIEEEIPNVYESLNLKLKL